MLEVEAAGGDGSLRVREDERDQARASARVRRAGAGAGGARRRTHGARSDAALAACVLPAGGEPACRSSTRSSGCATGARSRRGACSRAGGQADLRHDDELRASGGGHLASGADADVPDPETLRDARTLAEDDGEPLGRWDRSSGGWGASAG